jgi:hypothetical protein
MFILMFMCQKNAGRILRHSAINDIICRAFASVHVPAVLEPSALGCIVTMGRETLSPLSKGKCLLWDVTSGDTLAKSYITSTSRSAGAAALNSKTRKHKKYEGVSNMYNFVSFAVETLLVHLVKKP